MMNIVLAGYGAEGKASYDYWTELGHSVTIADERDAIDSAPDGVATITGPDAFTKLAAFDQIIRSPGVNPKKLSYGDKVWSATNEFFEKCPAPIIGVTGTKGKGTTSSLIASILTSGGYTVHLVGNIGVPALSMLQNISKDDIVVFELSSFQLWDIRSSPHVAVVLGIEEDHLDVHDDMADYIAAKANIARFQTSTDTIVYNQDNPIAREIGESASSKKVAYPTDEIMNKYGSSLVIPGRHNVENAAAAVFAASEYVSDSATIKEGLHSFTGLPHRIKYVRTLDDVSYYDDSYSSAPAAAVAALKSFDSPRVILLGGYEKHANYTELARYVATQDNVTAVLYGATKQRIADAFSAAGVDPGMYEVLTTTDFSAIVTHARSLAEPGGVVLLSPASASFDMFKNFTDRGERFITIVEAL